MQERAPSTRAPTGLAGQTFAFLLPRRVSTSAPHLIEGRAGSPSSSERRGTGAPGPGRYRNRSTTRLPATTTATPATVVRPQGNPSTNPETTSATTGVMTPT